MPVKWNLFYLISAIPLKGTCATPWSFGPATPRNFRIAGSAGADDQRAAGGLNVVAVAGAVLTGKTREIKDNVIYWYTVKVKLQPAVRSPCVPV